MRTTHGDHIPGTRLGDNPPLRPPRCGGVERCLDCITEACAVYKSRTIHLMVVDGERIQSAHEFIDYNREEHSDDLTKTRVLRALREAGVEDVLATHAINVMTHHGILFRERNTRS